MAKKQEQDLGGAVEGPPLTPPPPQTGPAIYPTVYKQMVEAARDFAKVGLAKTGTNEQQKFKFRGIDSLMDLASSILWRHNLLVLPNVVSRVVSERETRNGALLYSVTLDVEFTFVSATDASQHTVRFCGEAMDSGDKATNKAQSAAFKYCLLQCFCIPVEGAQDEADLTTAEETVVPPPEGYAIVKLAAQANAVNGTEPLREYFKSLKDTPGFASREYLIKVDKDWADIKATAERVDKVNADKAREAKLAASKAEADQIAAAIKATGVRVPGEDDGD